MLDGLDEIAGSPGSFVIADPAYREFSDHRPCGAASLVGRRRQDHNPDVEVVCEVGHLLGGKVRTEVMHLPAGFFEHSGRHGGTDAVPFAGGCGGERPPARPSPPTRLVRSQEALCDGACKVLCCDRCAPIGPVVANLAQGRSEQTLDDVDDRRAGVGVAAGDTSSRDFVPAHERSMEAGEGQPEPFLGTRSMAVLACYGPAGMHRGRRGQWRTCG